ncbi:MAG: PEP-CTERM sorting domain-containing protein [Planctomycetota bacterium]
MKMTLKAVFRSAIVAMVALATAVPAMADEVVTVDYTQNWIGFMNVFDRNTDGTPGGFQFGSGWGFNDLTAEFVGDELILGPNTIGDPDPFWYIGGGAPGAQGNKFMDANAFVQVTDGLSGMNVTFEGVVNDNTFTTAHVGSIFIRDFAPDFSTFNEVSTAITPGDFSITLATDAGAGRHVQYGFNVQGENVWVTDVGAFGTAAIRAVPEPASAMVLGLIGVGLVTRRRRG